MSAKIIRGKWRKARRSKTVNASAVKPAPVVDISERIEAKEAAEATERLHRALCLAAAATATGALYTEGRARLMAALLPAIGPGFHLAWSPPAAIEQAMALDAARDLYHAGEAGVQSVRSLCKQFGVKKLVDVPAAIAPELMAAIVAAHTEIDARWV